MRPLLLIAIFLSPIVGAILLGLLQLAVYRVMARLRGTPPERIPVFLILFARGLLAVVMIAIAGAIVSHLL